MLGSCCILGPTPSTHSTELLDVWWQQRMTSEEHDLRAALPIICDIPFFYILLVVACLIAEGPALLFVFYPVHIFADFYHSIVGLGSSNICSMNARIYPRSRRLRIFPKHSTLAPPYGSRVGLLSHQPAAPCALTLALGLVEVAITTSSWQTKQNIIIVTFLSELGAVPTTQTQNHCLSAMKRVTLQRSNKKDL